MLPAMPNLTVMIPKCPPHLKLQMATQTTNRLNKQGKLLENLFTTLRSSRFPVFSLHSIAHNVKCRVMEIKFYRLFQKIQ
jgi:hypothetical protein